LWNDRALQAEERGAATKIEQGAKGPCHELNSNELPKVIFPIAELTSQVDSRAVTGVADCLAGGESAFAYNSI
jgi:hypothetical protein